MPDILTVTLNPALDIATETAAVTPGPKLRCSVPTTDPGGGGVNVSRAIRFLSGESRAAVAVGGATGTELLRLMRQEGLAPVALDVRHPTRQSIAVTETQSGDQYRFVLPGPDWTQEDCETARNGIVDLCREGTLLIPSGSNPPGVPADFFTKLVEEVRAKGARVLLDTSGDALRAARAAQTGLHVLRMDGAEAADLLGAPLEDVAEIAAFARELRAEGVAEMVAISKGALGTVIASEEGCHHCRPPHVEPVSAIGAGDSFVAGFALGLVEDVGPLGATALGVGAAAAAVMTPATRLCDGPTARALRDQVEIRKV